MNSATLELYRNGTAGLRVGYYLVVSGPTDWVRLMMEDWGYGHGEWTIVEKRVNA